MTNSCEQYQDQDYSSPLNITPPMEKSPDLPILDLSCKKIFLPTSSPPTLSQLPPTSYSTANENHFYNYQGTTEKCENNNDSNHFNRYKQECQRQSPKMENRTFMVTPPSESNSSSPKRAKYSTSPPPIFDQSNFQPQEELLQQNGYSIMPINLPATMVPGVLSGLMNSPSVTMPTHINFPRSPSQPSQPITSNVDNTPKKITATRPFKAYGKEPFSFSFAPIAPDMLYDQEAFAEFRSRMLETVKRTNDGTNVKMRRMSKNPSSQSPMYDSDGKDSAYWERRRKNNEAAKRSRDNRRAKEDEIAIRAKFFEQQYIKAKCENAALRDEIARMSFLLYGR